MSEKKKQKNGESMVIDQRESERRAMGGGKDSPPAKKNGEGPKTPKRKGEKASPRAEKPEKGETPPKKKKKAQKGDKKPAEKERKPKTPGGGGMVGAITEAVCGRTKDEAITKGDLFDLLKKKFPERTDTAIMAWLNYFPGYCQQAGHTIHSEGRGLERTYWGEKNTHEPHGRRFGGVKKRKKVEDKPKKKKRKKAAAE